MWVVKQEKMEAQTRAMGMALAGATKNENGWVPQGATGRRYGEHVDQQGL